MAESEGPAAGLRVLDGLDAALPRSHRLAAVRGALLADLGLVADARGAYLRALELCSNQAEADHLRSRIRQLTEA